MINATVRCQAGTETNPIDARSRAEDNRGTTSGRVMVAAAPSKVPFYIAGGLLVVWAVLLAAWGISHAEFPGSLGRARLVMLTSFVLVAATMTAAVVTGGEEAEEQHAGGGGAPPRATGRTLALVADPAGALRFDKT